ncbi:MAG TPA: DUF4307 domain-containing protein [Actinomycetales bacterium]|nr:DUF4307 domain-containing protein [Actinomycetales bacterium]
MRDNPLRHASALGTCVRPPRRPPLSTAVPSRTPPPDRYGTPSAARRLAVVVASVVLAVAGLAWVIWAGLGQASADVRWTDVGFQIVDNSRVTVTYDVGKDPAATAVCSLQALDQGKSTVGIARVTIGPTSARVTRRTDEIRTSALAVTGVVKECALRP